MTTSEEIPPVLGVLGKQIRLAREDVGMTQADLAAKLYCTPQMVSAMELGRRPPKEPMIRAIEEQLGTGTRLLTIWEQMVKEPGAAQIAGLLELEEEATAIRLFQAVSVPGLFQTERFATAIMVGGIHAGLSEETRAAVVAARMARQDIFLGRTPPNIWAVIDESVLYRVIGNADIMREQFGKILGLIETNRRVRVQVLPYSEGVHVPAAPITILDVPDGRAAYEDGTYGGQLITDPGTTAKNDEWFRVLSLQAASLTDSARMIRTRMDEL